jgi:L-amino acid N-acyltransferase YncA
MEFMTVQVCSPVQNLLESGRFRLFSAMAIIRLASPSDAKGILDIYGPYVRDTSLTFETEMPTIEAFGERIAAYLNYCPWLVCEIDGRIAGYAYANRYRERAGYQWCVESSVYVHDDFLRRVPVRADTPQGGGVGTALYAALFEILKRQGFFNVYAVINLPNDRSVAFHEHMGFEYFATYKNVGYKLGKWKNVGWWQLILNEYIDNPPPPVPFHYMNKDFLPALLNDIQQRIRISS